MATPYNVTVGKHGNSFYMCIPSSIRNALDIKVGDKMTIWLEGLQIRAEKTVSITAANAAKLERHNLIDKPWLR